MRALTLSLCLLCEACAKSSAPVEPVASPEARAPLRGEMTTPSAPDAPPPPAPEPAAGKVEKAAPMFPDTAFPPAAIPPPHARSRQDRDGVWQAFGDAKRGDRLAEPPNVVYRTVIHPHPVSKWAKLTLAAI